jgi:hypothetical protein
MKRGEVLVNFGSELKDAETRQMESAIGIRIGLS